jgi:predicted nucleic acid-binding protein
MPEIAKEASLAVKTICSQIYPVTIEETGLALELLLNNPSIGTRDAIHAATMMNHGINRILSTDSHFDSIAGIERVQPV